MRLSALATSWPGTDEGDSWSQSRLLGPLSDMPPVGHNRQSGRRTTIRFGDGTYTEVTGESRLENRISPAIAGRTAMASSQTGKHAGPGTSSSQPAVAEPTFAERAHTLLHLGRIGALSTLSRKQQGFPFGSVMPYGLDENGRPVFLISTMAMHTQNLQADPRSSLLVTQPDASGDPLGASRVTLLGNVLPIPETEIAAARKLYLARYANSKNWVDFEDFSFYRMEVVDVYYVGGFGVMGWVPAAEYSQGQADPLADVAAGIIQHMNDDHGDALKQLAKALAGIDSQEARMTSVDRLGFHVRLKTPDGMRGARIAFSREVGSAAEARNVLIEMVSQARQK
jgi:putative heme iron utilization protein